jgi:hypothetical protein
MQHGSMPFLEREVPDALLLFFLKKAGADKFQEQKKSSAGPCVPFRTSFMLMVAPTTPFLLLACSC